MAFQSNVGGIGVGKTYGPTEADTSIDGSVQNSQGDGRYEHIVYATPDNLTSQTTIDLPAGAIIRTCHAVNVEAVSLTGTGANIAIGTEGTETSNSGCFVQTNLALGDRTDGTLIGTWAAPLAATTVVSLALGGSSPVFVSGKVKFVIAYDYLT